MPLWRLPIYDWRRRELRLMFVCLLVAVVAGSVMLIFSQELNTALTTHATSLIGADLVVHGDAPIPEPFEVNAAGYHLQTATMKTFPSMVFSRNKARLAMVEAVSGNFPLRGNYLVETGAEKVSKLGAPSSHMVYVDEKLAHFLNVTIGSSVTLGEATLTISGILKQGPVVEGLFSALAPALVLNDTDLSQTHLLGAFAHIGYNLYVAGDQGDVSRYELFAKQNLQRGMRIGTAGDLNPEISHIIQPLQRYFSLAAMVAVMLAAIAFAMCANAYVYSQRQAVGILLALGVVRHRILGAYVIFFSLLAILATLPGLLCGYLLDLGLTSILSPVLGFTLPSVNPAYFFFAGFLASPLLMLFFAIPALLSLNGWSLGALLCKAEIHQSGLLGFIPGFAVIAGVMLWQVREVWLIFSVGAMIILAVFFSRLLLIFWSRFAFLRPSVFSMAVGRLKQNGWAAGLQTASLAIALALFMSATLVRQGLEKSWYASLPADTPNHFFIDILPSEITSFEAGLMKLTGHKVFVRTMVKARLVAINGKPVMDHTYTGMRARHLANREFNLSETTQDEKNNLIEGHFLIAGGTGFSVESGLARTLDLHVGDWLSFSEAGRTITQPIVNLRKVTWSSFKVNFFVEAAPGSLAGWPYSGIASVYIPNNMQSKLELFDSHYPGISDIDVTQVIGTLRGYVNAVARGVSLLSGLLLISGVLLLWAGIVASFTERRRELALMRLLGAGQLSLLWVVVSEFGVMGITGGMIASILGGGLSQYLARMVFDLPPQYFGFLVLMGVLLGIAAFIAAGIFMLFPLLRHPPLVSLYE